MGLVNHKGKGSIRLSVSVFADKSQNGYTGLLDAIPTVIAEGRNKEELFRNLIENFQAHVEFLQEERLPLVYEKDFTTESIDLEISK